MEITDPAETVVGLLQKLIRFNTTNTGDPQTTHGEAECAHWIADQLTQAGYQPYYGESSPGRANVIVRLEGHDRSRPGLLIHGHLDVVPAHAPDWAIPPFSGEIVDGCVWGRGAVDMKGMVAMMLAIACHLKATNYRPPRDLVFAFVADEEAGGTYGAQWLVREHPELLTGISEAIGEVGGFPIHIPDQHGQLRRFYLIETAEKSLGWMRLTARGTAGHGSVINHDNAINTLVEALHRLSHHQFPLIISDPVKEFFTHLSQHTGWTLDAHTLLGSMQHTSSSQGGLAAALEASLHDTATLTMLEAGYKANVIPGQAHAVIDCRVLPGRQEAFEAELDEILGTNITREWITNHPAYHTSFSGDLVKAMTQALQTYDPKACTLPYMISAGTDAKAFTKLGIRCFGFTPLQMPPEIDFIRLFHGVDERVPVEALQFGTRVLHYFLTHC